MPLRVACLPPYAPNLNLIERPWRSFTNKAPWNTRHPSRAAIRGFFNTLGQWNAERACPLTSRCHLIRHKPARISAA